MGQNLSQCVIDGRRGIVDRIVPGPGIRPVMIGATRQQAQGKKAGEDSMHNSG